MGPRIHTLCMVALVLMLGACSPTPLPSVAPTAVVTPTVLLTVTETPTLAPTAIPTVTPTRVPPLPTATLFAGSTARKGEYRNEELGVSLRYPDTWTQRQGTSTSMLAVFSAPQDRALGTLVSVPADPDESLQQAASMLIRTVIGGSASLTTTTDEAITLGDGHAAWSIVVQATTQSGMVLKGSIVTAVHRSRLFIVFVMAPAPDYDSRAAEINVLLQSLRFDIPKLNGIPRDQVLILQAGESTNARSYDPATTQSGGDHAVFSGLVAFDPQLRLVPDLASSWDLAEGITYTFHLRPNARFHNGRPVSASDFVYSWERAADPKTQSDTVLTYLGDIVGVRAMKEGQANHIAGIRALDEHTLQVTVDAPKPYFLYKLTFPAAFVVDRENVESGPEWYRTPNGTGPYRLARWDRFQQILLERNDSYYREPPAIPFVLEKVFAGVGIRLYETGEVDLTAVSPGDVSRVQDPKEPLHADVVSDTGLCTRYALFDVEQPPFDDVKVRQALALAFDREKYIELVMHGVGLPAKGLYPPALPGYNSSLPRPSYDPARARQLLAESKYGSPANLAPILYTTAGRGTSVNKSVAAQVEMWQTTLGISITIENLEPDKYIDEVTAGRHGQILESSWCADYPDPEDFADVLFHSGSKYNWGHYSNPRVDALLEQARVEQDVARRIELYQQVEQLINDDAPAVFIMHPISYALVKPYVQGFTGMWSSAPMIPYLRLDAAKLK